jgi:hypothetical protein
MRRICMGVEIGVRNRVGNNCMKKLMVILGNSFKV